MKEITRKKYKLMEKQNESTLWARVKTKIAVWTQLLQK